jgi:hypothetical protein
MLGVGITFYFWTRSHVCLHQFHQTRLFIFQEDYYEEGYHPIAGSPSWVSVQPARIIETA